MMSTFQLVLCVVQSCLLSLENDIVRVTLAVFLIPIIARMCAVPIDRLIIAHNVACSLAILVICIYVLNKTPALLLSIRHSVRYLKAIVILRGIGGGGFDSLFLLFFKTQIFKLKIMETSSCSISKFSSIKKK